MSEINNIHYFHLEIESHFQKSHTPYTWDFYGRAFLLHCARIAAAAAYAVWRIARAGRRSYNAVTPASHTVFELPAMEKAARAATLKNMRTCALPQLNVRRT